MKTTSEKFLSKVNKNGQSTDCTPAIGRCWEWTGVTDKDGYGRFFLNGKYHVAHRYSWSMFQLAVIDKSILVLHKCDNPPCVNPDHLFLGTHFNNIQDKVSKNRQAKGEKQSIAKLNDDSIIEIRYLYSIGQFSQSELSDQYQVNQCTISKIIHRKIWKHL